MPGSYCYKCGSSVRWFDNIPIWSYVILRGRCRVCKAPFSMRYAVVECLTGVLFLAVFLRYGFSWATLVYLVFTGLLLVGAFTDIDHWIIPDRISLGGAVAGLGFALLLPLLPAGRSGALLGGWLPALAGPASGAIWWGPAVNALIGGLFGSGLLWLIGFAGSIVFRKPAMGFGDVKLLAMIGAFLGWQIGILTIFLASVLGAIYGLSVLALSRPNRFSPKDKTEEKPLRTFEEIHSILEDDSEAARRRGWNFSESESTVLNHLLAAPARSGPGAAKRHLPFGPHLAIAAWVLMWWGPDLLDRLAQYFSAPF